MLLSINPQFKTILFSTLILFAIALIFGIFVVVIYRFLNVPPDEKEEKVHENLAGANCGGCGHPNCEQFAKALCAGTAKLSECGVTSKESKEIIAGILGVENKQVEEIVVVNCRGGKACLNKGSYSGYTDCRAANLVAGGHKQCYTGCLGGKTCEYDCPTNAIVVAPEDGYAKIDQSKCIKCGLCITQCPKNIITRIPANAKILIACSNHNKGRDVKSICATGCIGCGICARTCKKGGITMVDNLPVIDYSICDGCAECVEKCPTGTIVWI